MILPSSRLRAKPRNPSRGSLLITALFLSAAIAVVLTSYLTMATTALNLATRASQANDAMNLTESGLEQALSAMNASLAIDSFTLPSPWTNGSAGNATATFSGFTYSQGATGVVKVYIQGFRGATPLVVAEGIITPARGTPIVKMVEISGIAQRSLFAKGLVGRNGLSFTGNGVTVDSWNSTYNADGTLRASPVVYSNAVKNANGSIASVIITAGTSVQNADIYGTASVGGNSTSLISVGAQGLVGPFGTASGTKDPNSISANFTDNLPAVVAPTPSVTNTIVSYASIPNQGSGSNAVPTLPQVNGSGVIIDSPASDGKYYYSIPNITGSLNITGNKSVVLLPTAGPGTDAISLTGQASISIASGSSLAVYTPANITITGQGTFNNGNSDSSSSSLQIWGTNTSSTPPGQTFTITGNGNLDCTCYAPNAAITAKGGGNSGSIYGSFVGYTIDMAGHDTFHYDEALGHQANASSYSPSKWRELVSSTDRALYASALNF